MFGDPKPAKRTERRYKCQYCGEYFYMSPEEYKRLSLGIKRRCCQSNDCLAAAAVKHINKKRESQQKTERAEWRKRKEKLQVEVGGKKKKQSEDPLQRAVNKIAVLLDSHLPCLARPFDICSRFEGGHVIPVGRYQSIRYHLWNIHKQGHISNQSQKDDLLMLEGVGIRYGDERKEFVEGLPLLYPILKPTIEEKKAALKVANQIIRDLERGKSYTRDEVNSKINLYKNG